MTRCHNITGPSSRPRRCPNMAHDGYKTCHQCRDKTAKRDARRRAALLALNLRCPCGVPLGGYSTLCRKCAGKAARARQLAREQSSADGQCRDCHGVGHRQAASVSLAEIAQHGLFCRSCRGTGHRRAAVRPQHAERAWEAERAA